MHVSTYFHQFYMLVDFSVHMVLIMSVFSNEAMEKLWRFQMKYDGQ